MKKALYIEAFSGISGNMLLGALIDLGADAAYIEAELKKMNLGEYELINTRAYKCGINAAYFNVKIPGVTEAAEAEEAHLHEHHDGHHCHHHAHGCEGEEHHHHHEEHHCCHQHGHAAEEAHEQTGDIEGVGFAHAQHFFVDSRAHLRHASTSAPAHDAGPRPA